MATSDGRKAILSIDGGGIRGIIPALVLEELEKRLKNHSKNAPLHRYFDLIVGTSTGGIIAAGLAAPDPHNGTNPALAASGLVEIYNKRGSEIFSRGTFKNIREVFRTANFSSLIQEAYSADRLEEILYEYLGERRLREAMTNVVLTAYDIERRETAYIRGGPDINDLDDANGVKADYHFAAATRATTAAPTYFEPERVLDLHSKEVRTLIDGGVFANQPAVCAFAQARALGWPVDEICMLSLGTGYQTRPYRFDDVKDWGPVQWINPMKGAPIISILMQGQSDSTDWNMLQILGETGFCRLDGKLDPKRGSDEMDDASRENLNALTTLAREIISKNDAAIDFWAQSLTDLTD